VEPARIADGPDRTTLSVVHLVDACGGEAGQLWGKERAVAALMLAQRDSGDVAPALVCFSPCALADVMRAEGFPVTTLEDGHRRLPLRALGALRAALRARPPAVLHTHGYKANVVGRLARATGTRMAGLVSTCHGWGIESGRAGLYNEIDRSTTAMSDATTVAGSDMLARFGRDARVTFVANGIPDRPAPTPLARAASRAHFGFPNDRIVITFVGRTTTAKGFPDVVAAARALADLPLVWAIAGANEDGSVPHDDVIANAHLLGYERNIEELLEATDVYVQASHAEGLSLALLEAMRAGCAIAATATGATAFAVRHEIEGFLFPANDVDALCAALRRLVNDATERAHYGAAARARFERTFRIERQHRAFLELYRDAQERR
jgi:glycosyltransferase involved in cell wall biosynthesis